MTTPHRVDWFVRDPGGGTLHVKPERYTADGIVADLARAKAQPPRAFTPEELVDLCDATDFHAETCDCPAFPDRHSEHDHRSRATVADAALYDLAVASYAPHAARIRCGECGAHWATEGELTRAQHRAGAACEPPITLHPATCPACTHDL